MTCSRSLGLPELGLEHGQSLLTITSLGILGPTLGPATLSTQHYLRLRLTVGNMLILSVRAGKESGIALTSLSSRKTSSLRLESELLHL